MVAGMGGLERLLSGVAADPALDAVLLLDSADVLLSARHQLMGLADPAPHEAAALGEADPSLPQLVPRTDDESMRWEELIDELDKTRSPDPVPGPTPTPVGSPPDQVFAGAAEVMLDSGLAVTEMLRGAPYLEDAARTIIELSALSAPGQRSSADRLKHGPVLGTRRATELRDIAWVPALIEAAKYHEIRRHYSGPPEDHGLILSPTDLQSYRREQDSQFLLVVVTDGLGNIPLAASLTEVAQVPFAGQGVADALSVATRIAALRAVRSVVITPERVPHRELPEQPAAAMGAGIIRARAVPAAPGREGVGVSDES